MIAHIFMIYSTSSPIIFITLITIKITTLPLHQVTVFEGTKAVLPGVVSVMQLEVLHEGPVQVSVALGEVSDVVETAPEKLGAREVGGA